MDCVQLTAALHETLFDALWEEEEVLDWPRDNWNSVP